MVTFFHDLHFKLEIGRFRASLETVNEYISSVLDG